MRATLPHRRVICGNTRTSTVNGAGTSETRIVGDATIRCSSMAWVAWFDPHVVWKCPSSNSRAF
jgi:hypothetical protein